MINQIDINADNRRHHKTKGGYPHDDEPVGILANIFISFWVVMITLAFSTIILGWVIGAEAVSDMFGEWIYQIKY